MTSRDSVPPRRASGPQEPAPPGAAAEPGADRRPTEGAVGAAGQMLMSLQPMPADTERILRHPRSPPVFNRRPAARRARTSPSRQPIESPAPSPIAAPNLTRSPPRNYVP